MTDNAYINALNKSNLKSNAKISHSPKGQIILDQKDRCYLCDKSFGNTMRYFSTISGPDPKTGIPSKGVRAICTDCYFKSGKK